MARRTWRQWTWLPACGVGLTLGCASQRVEIPNGHLPPVAATADAQTAVALGGPLPRTAAKPAATTPPPAVPPGVNPPPPGKKATFELPPTLPGGDAPPFQPPRFDKDTPAAERTAKVAAAYPTLTPVAAFLPASDAPPLTLAELQQTALANSPDVKRARAEADASYGQVIQAGLHPNPTVGYQGDQIQPGPRDPSVSRPTAGQQGGYVSQLIKTAGKLGLAQQVAGYDYVNALVAVRRAEVDAATAVRSAYFAAVVAEQGVAVNRALADLADEVYALQLKQVAAGVAAGYEPLQLYAQAAQARAAVAQSEAAYRAAWKQLAAAVNRPDLPVGRLAGRADAVPPAFDQEALRACLIEQHTDLLTARNGIAQSQTNLELQRRTPIPDLQTNSYYQYDNQAGAFQFGVQLGVELPLSNRNQGNVRTARARVASAGLQLAATQNTLLGRLAEAYGRYEANAATAAAYRDQVLPGLSQAYRLVVRRYQGEEAVQFADVVLAQQNLGTGLQGYLAALSAQWQAVADVANVAQLDDLYAPANCCPAVQPPPRPVPTSHALPTVR